MSSQDTEFSVSTNSQVTPDEYETILMLTRKMEGEGVQEAKVSSPEQELQEGMIPPFPFSFPLALPYPFPSSPLLARDTSPLIIWIM